MDFLRRCICNFWGQCQTISFHFGGRKLPPPTRPWPRFDGIVTGTPLIEFGAWSVKLRHFTRTMWGQAAIAGWTPRCLRWASSTTSWTSLTSTTSWTTPRTSLSESDNSGWVLVLRKVEPQRTPLMAGLQNIYYFWKIWGNSLKNIFFYFGGPYPSNKMPESSLFNRLFRW